MLKGKGLLTGRKAKRTSESTEMQEEFWQKECEKKRQLHASQK